MCVFVHYRPSWYSSPPRLPCQPLGVGQAFRVRSLYCPCVSFTRAIPVFVIDLFVHLLSFSPHYIGRWLTVITYVCVFLYCIVCVRGVSLLTLTLLHLAKFRDSYVHISIYTQLVHGYAYAHYRTHTHTARGEGFRNESGSQVEKSRQLFHPHTYATPTPYLPPSYDPPTHPSNP